VAEVVIIGAGLTGLSAAYHFEKKGFFDYEIYEKNDRAGGLLRSTQQDGFTFDYTGHLLHVNDDYFESFLETITGLDTFNNIERRSAIYSHNVTTDYPFQINLHGLPTDVITDCIQGYITRKTSIRSPQNFYDWVMKHFGKGFGKHFFFSYQEKILAYDIKKVHPGWTGRFVPKTSLESIIKGALQKKPPSGIGYNSSFYYPKSGGIEFLIKQMKKQLTNPIQVKKQAEYIDTQKKIVHFTDGTSKSYNKLISTMPLNTLLTQVNTSSRSVLGKASEKLLCNSVVNFNLGFIAENLSDKHWIYFPEKDIPMYRLGFWHNICPASVPLGYSAIYGEYAYLKEKTSRNALKKITENAIDKTLKFLGLSEKHIALEKVLNLDHAYVIYDGWREKNLPRLLALLAEKDIHSVGRYGSWKYSSMQEAVLDGKKAAEMLSSKINKKGTTYNNIHQTQL